MKEKTKKRCLEIDYLKPDSFVPGPEVPMVKLTIVSYERTPIFAEIEEERRRQDKQWGGKDHDDTQTISDWGRYISQKTARVKICHYNPTVAAECNYNARKELLEIAALAVAAIESIDRKEKSIGSQNENGRESDKPG